MRVALFVPCYVDQFAPQVAAATLALLQGEGLEVSVPSDPVCCGQALTNSGYLKEALPVQKNFLKTFSGFDYVVAPSASCVSMIRNHLDAEAVGPGAEVLQKKTFEICEFLHDVVGFKNLRFKTSFTGRVGLHVGCHGIRELRLASSSERHDAPFSKVRKLLERVEGLQIAEPERSDECCGFGGSFAVFEEPVSARMGEDRIEDFSRAAAQVLISTDVSCLLHLDGTARRRGKMMKCLHISEVLAGTALTSLHAYTPQIS